MATEAGTADYLIQQASGAGVITVRKMFGEYAIYCDGLVFGFICDDQLFVKPTEAGRQFIGEPEEAPAYPGSKNYFLISEDSWGDEEWLAQLVAVTVSELKQRPKKRKGS